MDSTSQKTNFIVDLIYDRFVSVVFNLFSTLWIRQVEPATASCSSLNRTKIRCTVVFGFAPPVWHDATKKIVTVNNITYLVNRNAWKSDICWHCNWWYVKIIQILTWPSRDWQPKEEQNNLMCFGVLHPQFWWARTAYYKPSLWLHAFMVSALLSWWNLDIKRDGDDFSLWLPFRFNWS